MGFRRQIGGARVRLRLFLLAALVLSAVAGRSVGEALLFTVEPERHYDLGEPLPMPPWWRYYPNQVAGALMLLVWVQYVRMRARCARLLLVLVDARSLEEFRLANVAQEIAIAANIPPPKLYVAEDPSLNAFACGGAGRSSIVVTRGLLERLDRDELQGVIAHETAHIRNGDTLLMTALFGLSRVFGLTAAFAFGPIVAIWRAAAEGDHEPEKAVPLYDHIEKLKPPPTRWGGKIRPGWMAIAFCFGIPLAAVVLLALALAVSIGVLVVFGLVVRYLPILAVALALWELWKLLGEPREKKPRRRLSAVMMLTPVGLIAGPAILLVGCVFPFVFWLLRLAVSRNQEFMTDASAIELTRHPDGLRSALEKLLADATPETVLPRSLSPLAIATVGAMRHRDDSDLPAVLRRVLALFSTHPPLKERIARLEAMGAHRVPEPETAAP